MKAAKPLAGLGALFIGAAAAFLLLADARDPAPLVTDVIATPMHGLPGTLAVTARIENRGGPDQLTGAASDEATAAIFDGAATAALPIPAGSTPLLATDGAFLRLEGVTGPLDDGRLIPLTLSFARGGDIALRARLVPMTDHMGHGMGKLHEPAEGETVPTLTLRLTADGDGWIVTAETTGFAFSEDLVDQPHVPGTGHAHLYLDGLKLQRMYDPTARIGALPPGQHIVQVTLNTNDHQAYASGNETVTAMALIDVH